MVEDTKSKNMTATAVFLPDILADFSCAMCGECCNVWEIPVDRDSYSKAVEAIGEEAARNLQIVDEAAHFDYARLKLQNGRCPFQQGDLCRVHRDYGEEVLFPECRKFPRVLFRSPIALHCTVSFACKKTVESLQKRRVRIMHVTTDAVSFPESFCDTTVESLPRLSRDREMTWDALFALEHGFLDILRDPDFSPEHALLTMIELVRNLTKEDASPIDGNTVDRELAAARIDGFDDLRNRFLLASTDPQAQVRFMLGTLEGRIEAGISRHWELVPLDAALTQWQDLPLDLAARKFQTDYRRCFLPAAAEINPIIKNYLTCRVTSNIEYVILDVFRSLKATAALTALIRAVATALAAASRKPITASMLTDAIRAVDTAFFHLSDFTENVDRAGANPAELLIITPS